MIRVNLLGGERQKVKASAVTFDINQRITAACVLVVVVSALGIGWWYWSLSQTSTRLDEEIAAAQQEQVRLQAVLAEVREFEQRRGQLQQRVALIEQLRSGQSVPVQILDHVSRSLPDTLWLTQMSEKQSELTIQGRSGTLIELSDFVANLGESELLTRPIEIVDSKVESVTPAATGGPQGPATEVISFTVKAKVAGAPGAKPAAPAGGAR